MCARISQGVKANQDIPGKSGVCCCCDCGSDKTRSDFFPGICELEIDSQSDEQQGFAENEEFPLLSGLQQLCESSWSSMHAHTPAQT